MPGESSLSPIDTRSVLDIEQAGGRADETGMAQAGTSRFRIGVDTGGTFTDIVAVDTGSGAMRVTKIASTPLNPAVGLVRGVAAILQKAGATAADVSSLAHGTTVATNALLQGEIASLGLIVTSERPKSLNRFCASAV
jgi:hypothetical protein